MLTTPSPLSTKHTTNSGIANITGVDTAALILYNMGYEIEGGCTSIVAQNANEEVFHARNLDFGLFFGWDKVNHTWELTELLRPLLFNARVTRGGQTLFNATYYAGFVGLLTGECAAVRGRGGG